MNTLKCLLLAVCGITFINACLSEEIAADSGSFQEEREISINGTASVADLYQVLHDWEKIKPAIKKYVQDNKRERLTRCDLDGLTIEDIQGIGGYNREEAEEYHPDLLHIIANKNVVLQVLVTTHPCFLQDGGRNITWFFYRDRGKYTVLDDLTVL